MTDQTQRTLERLAVLESKMDASKDDRANIRLSVENVRRDVDNLRQENLDRMDEIVDKINSIDLKLSKYTGFWGGIVMVVGAVWSFLHLFWKPIAAKLGLGN